MTETGDVLGWEEGLGDFWAGIVEELRVSPARHRVVMTVRISGRAGEPLKKADHEVQSWYELAFEGVTRFDFSDSDASPWWVIELTEVTQRARDGGTEYRFTLTEVEDALHIICDGVRVALVDRDENE